MPFATCRYLSATLRLLCSPYDVLLSTYRRAFICAAGCSGRETPAMHSRMRHRPGLPGCLRLGSLDIVKECVLIFRARQSRRSWATATRGWLRSLRTCWARCCRSPKRCAQLHASLQRSQNSPIDRGAEASMLRSTVQGPSFVSHNKKHPSKFAAGFGTLTYAYG